MNKQINAVRKTRLKMLDLVNSLSQDQLNKIPAGFNNNIIWNLGHLIAAQEGILYLRGGHNLRIDQTFFDSYKMGSKPERELESEEIENIKSLLISSIDYLEDDFQKGIFQEYPNWTTRFDVEISSFEDAMDFLIFHEGLHLGCMTALKRLIA
ncbi:DinB family protein [Daejeonella sp. H1SJ63]|jgi:hypothetical protein|uniref:DinB family protein n=1 Tax=Daejeonella sp. H1SJ63 TaxID=3034145 RepID=UPI0023ED6224|nr:DinB family protein [Daejeonella sp. H1SJ63]